MTNGDEIASDLTAGLTTKDFDEVVTVTMGDGSVFKFTDAFLVKSRTHVLVLTEHYGHHMYSGNDVSRIVCGAKS